MIHHKDVEKATLHSMIRKGEITLAGNKKLKIYGRLKCASGRRMKAENRIFFKNEQDALQCSFRPCGHCMMEQYKHWKNESI